MKTFLRGSLAAVVVVGVQGWAWGQRFGEDRPLTPAAPAPMAPAPAPAAPAPMGKPPETLPTFPTQPVALPTLKSTPAQPAYVEPPHEWAIKPEHGEWMICVKSYSGEKAREHATEMARLIRTNQRAATYVFERNAEERQREEVRLKEYREMKLKELTPFLQVQAQMKLKAGETGAEFVDTATTIRVPKPKMIPQDWAVLVGGFETMDKARQALDTIRKWPTPQNETLLDRAVMTKPGNGKSTTEAVYINPFTTALVVPNPSIRRAQNQVNVDPIIWKLNEEEPMSLLNSPKTWTLIVKDFSVPTSVQTKDQDGGILGKIFGDSNDPAKVLDATALQAREMAKALRDPKMQQAAEQAARRNGLTPRPLESFVLHVRTGSRVTVGQFDGPNDPALLEMHNLLRAIYFEVWDKPKEQGGKLIEKRFLFDNIIPMPIPKK
ncbi:MAG: hypothetical protein ACRC8S_00215 [Fimbriiglobus sp.]